jgi:hypothetical protein
MEKIGRLCFPELRGRELKNNKFGISLHQGEVICCGHEEDGPWTRVFI